MKKRIAFIAVILFVFGVHLCMAQVNINVKSQMATRGYYSITYSSYGSAYSMGPFSIDAGGDQNKSVPAGAANIVIKLSYSNWGSEKTLKTINAGRSGGTVIFKGDLAFTGISSDWEPTDNVSGTSQEVAVNVDMIYPNGDAELHKVARDKNALQMQSLIDKGTTKVNTKNNRGFTPLHECIQSDFAGGIDILLKAGADMTIENNNGENAFVMAVGLGKKEMADKFISQGYPAGTDKKAMELVIRKRNEPMLKLLLDNGADANQAMNTCLQQNNMNMVELILNNYNPTPSVELYKKLVDARRFDIAKRIVEANIDANQALDYAILKNVPDLVQASMEKGGDAQKALSYAIANRKPDIAAAAITSYNAKPDMVMEDAIRQNQTDVVTLLLDNNADASLGLTYAINNNKNNFIPMMLAKGAKVTDEQITKVAAGGDNTLVKTLVEAGGNKNAALAAAMGAKKFQTATMLVQAGATPDNIVNPAVENNQKELLVAALEAGANANEGLNTALNQGKKDFAELLFKAGAKTDDAAVIKNVITKGDLSVLKLMIDNQTNANIGMTAAVELNNTAAVQMLMDNNADAKPAGLIATAVKNKNQQMVELLLKGGADAKPAGLITAAAAARNQQLVETLLKAGASPDNGILTAVQANDAVITRLLLNAGAKGNSAQLINTSVPKNNAELTGLLLDAGANPADAVNAAVVSNANNVLALLISKGADVKNPALVTAAIKNNSLSNLSLLIAAGNDMNYKDNAGNSYLHIAAASEADAVVTALAAAGVKVNDLNNAKDAPIHIAVTQGRKEVELVEAFLTAGADANALNGSGKKPLDLAKGTRIKKRLKEAGGSKD